MADTILSADITIRYLDDNRCKFARWTGSATGTRTMNEFYSAMGTLLDETATGDDATMFTAETPVEYTTGIIDANDGDPWYVQYELMQHITGGALRTAGWTRTPGSATGIVVVPVTSNTIVAADVGFDITHSPDSDAGTLLEVIEQGSTDYLVIRPDSNAAANNFDSTSGTLTCNSNTATQDAASTTGEQIWPNIYNVLPVDADTHAYVYQGLVSDATRARVADINVSTNDWWPEGAFDRLIFIRDYKTDTNPLIDDGYMTVFARKGNTLYDSFEFQASTTSGGRNPIPLKPSADANHTTGYQSITQTASAGNWSVGDEVEGDTSGARAIITQIDSPGATQTLHYYLIGDPQTTFQTAAETLTNNDDTGTGTKDGNVVADQGPALATWFTSNSFPTVTHAATTFDIDDDGTAEGWGYTIDCNANPLTEVYEWTQHEARNGETGTAATDGIEGEQYVGPTVYLEWSGTVSGTMTEGNDVTQATSLATGIIVSKDETLKQMLLRDVRGTFDTSNLVTDNDASGTVTPDVAATAFNAFTDAPLGRFAGGRWFGARGGLLADWVSGDENSFQLIDSQGNDRTRPIAISLSISNLRATAITDATADYAVMHRLTGLAGAIDKTEYSSTGGTALAATTQVVDTAITADTPGKTTGAVLNVRDASDNNQHYRIRFASWATSTFTLASFNLIGGATAGTNTTTIVYSTGGFNAGIQRGDIVWNTTRTAFAYVDTVDSDTQVTLDRAIASQTSTDAIDFNVMPIDDDTADDVYVSLIDEYPTASPASVSIVFVGQIYYRVKVSNTRHTTKQRRFVTDDTTTGTDRNTANIVNEDTIHT